MSPKPTREWVIAELESLGVRVVTSRSTTHTDGVGKEIRQGKDMEENLCKQGYTDHSK